MPLCKGVFLFLSDLQAEQVGEAQLQLVLLFEVLHNTAIICVSRLHGQGEPVRVREWEKGKNPLKLKYISESR